MNWMDATDAARNRRTLITGITGQDGSYLAELLLSKGYEVHGLIRRASTFNTYRIDHIYQDPQEPKTRLAHAIDAIDARDAARNNLGAQSHVRVSFDMRKPPFQPRSPYAAAKVYAYWMVVNYREGYNLFACNGILFNHESPRRGETFVTRKITRAIANILAGRQKKLYLGNLDARRDWGYAPEYIEAMWLMLQHDKPEDYVIGTGESHSVREFVEYAFNYAGIEIEWKGKGVNEKGVVKSLSSTSTFNHCVGNRQGYKGISICRGLC